MTKESFSPDSHKESTSVEEFETFLGNETGNHLYQRLITVWRTQGKEAAKRFCINDADKFDFLSGDDRVQLYLEDKLFDAGPNGTSKKTPWNDRKRREAGLPFLHSFE